MKQLEELSKDEWKSLIKSIPHIGDKLGCALWSYDYNHHTDQNKRIYRVHNKDKKGLLKVSQLRMFVQDSLSGNRIEPITVRWNLGGNSDIYSVMFFDEPKDYQEIKKIHLGVGVFNSEREQWQQESHHKNFVSGNAIDNLVEKITTYGVPSQLWPWSDADIHVDVDKKEAELWYHGMDAKTPAVAVSRDYGLRLYKLILGVLGKDEGNIHHSYPSGHHPRLTDSGANNPPWIKGL